MYGFLHPPADRMHIKGLGGCVYQNLQLFVCIKDERVNSVDTIATMSYEKKLECTWCVMK
jgi:hypothetical protein